MRPGERKRYDAADAGRGGSSNRIDVPPQTELHLYASKTHPSFRRKAEILGLADPLPDTRLEGALARYLLAFGSALVALLIQISLHPLLGDHLPYLLFFPAIALCAWLCGAGASIIAVLLALAGARYWFMSPAHSLGIPDRAEAPGMVAFLFLVGDA